MKDLSDLYYFLGMEVTRNKDGLFLSQKKYAHDILELTHMTDSWVVQTPIP